MKRTDFHQTETILPPQKEAELRAALANREEALGKSQEENQALKSELERKDAIIAQLQKALYGQKSEKTEYLPVEDAQLSLFNEAEQAEDQKLRQREEAVVVPEHQRKPKRTHEEMARDLPTEEVVHPVAEETCALCGEPLTPVGKEFVRDELIYVPARLFVRKHYVEVRQCGACGQDERVDQGLADVAAPSFYKGTTPAPLLPHSFCSAELLAHIVYEKYAKGVPLYRQEKDFAALGLRLSRATMANWIMVSARQWLRPLWLAMKAELLKSRVIHADETVVQVLKEPGKKPKSESRMWVYCAGEIGQASLILFDYQPTRKGDHARDFLGDYRGYLVSDGYRGYGKVVGVSRCGCWAHARRKFVEALPVTATEAEKGQATVAVDYINRLFIQEKAWRALEPEERRQKRQEEAKPLLDEFFAWAKTLRPSGGTKLAQAIGYVLEQKPYLLTYLEDGAVPLSNNRAENAIRPFVIGRKQWLFCDSVKGAESSAILYSLAATACANGLNVEKYFAELFRELSQRRDGETTRRLMPIHVGEE